MPVFSDRDHPAPCSTPAPAPLGAETNPLRSAVLLRPAAAVFGFSAEQRAEFIHGRDLADARHALDSANSAVAYARQCYVEARRDIGLANQGVSRGLLIRDRRQARSIAFIAYNACLRVLRRAKKRREAAEARVLALVEV